MTNKRLDEFQVSLGPLERPTSVLTIIHAARDRLRRPWYVRGYDWLRWNWLALLLVFAVIGVAAWIAVLAGGGP